jgi:3-dehydroquinate synthase
VSRARSRERWGSFARLARALPVEALIVADARVLALHPAVRRALSDRRVLPVQAGEALKSFAGLERILRAGSALSRDGWLVALGGGTVGDTCTVAAHLLKRGVRLLQVPTTTLAAVDSSVGGKGAIDLRVGTLVLKNAAGVFHPAEETWICPELFASLSPHRFNEGRVEAWKMFCALDASAFQRHLARPPALRTWLTEGRNLKQAVCAEDPRERNGRRAVLNFGHTLGHALESATGFRLSHGDAVGLGLRCALDAGRALGVTPPALAMAVEAGLEEGASILSRAHLARALRRVTPRRLATLLGADKKRRGGVGQMVLLERLGHARLHTVPDEVPLSLLAAWRAGARP